METPKRKAISKKMRFEVFKRDSFTCQYCSVKPPKIPLEVDHIQPVCKGGVNNIDNLITACFDCNRGKSGNELTNVPSQLSDKIERMKIAQSQYKQFKKLIEEQKKIINFDVDLVDEVFTSHYPELCLSMSFRVSVKKFIEALGVDDVMYSMDVACSKMRNDHHALKYFCGMCWGKIREI